MVRFVLMTWGCVIGCQAFAAEPTVQTAVQTMVVADSASAAFLQSLPSGVALGVLIQDEFEDYEVVNARAFAMRHATFVVYLGGQESPLSALFLERLQTHGVVAIDLRKLASNRFQNTDTQRKHVSHALLTQLTSRDN